MIKCLTIITCCCFLAACSQSPSSSVNHVSEVTGTVSFGSNVPDIHDFEVRAYAYVSQQWQNNTPVNTVAISSNGAYALKLPEGNYIFTLFNKQQNGPEFYYQFQNQFPCKTYELRLQDHYSETVFANKLFLCEPEVMSVPNQGSLNGINFEIQETGTITGQISQADGSPFSLVTIKAFACKTRDVQSAIDTLGKYETSFSAQSRPDANGSYTICCLPKGDYLVMAEADRSEYITTYYDRVYFKDQAKTIEIDSGNDWTVNFIMNQGVTITGQVKSEDNPIVPIEGVLVSAIMTPNSYVTGKSVPSDADGNYTISGLLTNHRYILYANSDHTEYQSCYYINGYNTNDAVAFDIINNAPLIMDFDLQKKGKLVATIIDNQTKTLITNSQIYVKIYKSSNLTFVKDVYPDNGIITTELEEGDYKAEIITSGTPYASMFHSNENNLQDADDIPIFNGEVNESVKFKLQRGGSIKGLVVGQDCDYPNNDLYLHNYTVVAYSKSNPSRIYQAKTDIYGEYLINGLSGANDYIVQVLTDDTSYISEYFKQTFFQKTATNIQVSYDAITPNINFDLECGRQIFGKISNDTNNDPIPGINITATNLNNNETYSATTDENGTYVITGIPSGYEYSIPSAYEYAIYVNTSGTSFVPVTYGSNIQFERDEKQIEINFSLELLPKISGIVTCPSNHQFDYCFDNITPGIYDLILLDEQNNETKIREDFELIPGKEIIIQDIAL